MRQDGELRYLLADHLGSTTHVLDDAGAADADDQERYYPFGRTRNVRLVPTDKEFTGHQREGDLIFMKARFYDPVGGRFLQPDTIVPDYGTGQALNRYNNPMRYTDPTGRCGFDPNNPGANNLLGLCGTGTTNTVTNQPTPEVEAPPAPPRPGGDVRPTRHPMAPPMEPIPMATPCPEGACPNDMGFCGGPLGFTCDVGGAIAGTTKQIGQPILDGATHFLSHLFPECLERLEMALAGSAVVIFGGGIIIGGCGVIAPVVGAATLAVGGVATCVGAVTAGGIVIVGGGLIAHAAFKPWNHGEEH